MMKKLLQFITDHAGDDVSRLILDRKKYPEIDMDLAVNCIESRRKLKSKVNQWYDCPQLIFPLKLSAEQCSSSATGLYKAELAERIADREEWSIADLTGGLGVDSWFFSKKASEVIYNEMQSVLCDAARHNFKELGAENIEIVNSMVTADNIEDIIGGRQSQPVSLPHHDRKVIDIVYMDPARRGEGGRKVFLIEDCTPDVLTLKDKIFEHTRHILIKLSPMADITMVCDRLGSTCREVHVVSTGGECKELLIWMDREWSGEYTIIAVELHTDSPASTFSFTPSAEKASISNSGFGYGIELLKALRQNGGVDMPPPARGCLRAEGDETGVNGTICLNAVYLFEPGKSLLKSGAFNLLATHFEIAKLGKSTHYYITDSEAKAQTLKSYGKVFKIIEIHPLDKRSIKEIGKKYPKAEVTARNIPMDTDTLRKKTGVTSGDDAHIFGLKSDIDGNILIAAMRI